MRRLSLMALAAIAPLCAQTVVIRNATIMTVTHGTVKGSIVVKDGKIAAIGEKVMEPANATVIDAGGQYVIPGIIDCHSHIAGEGGINEGSVSVSSMVDIKDIINPEDVSIYRALAGGVTSANILHGSANSIGGQSLVLKMRWGTDARKMVFEGATPGIKFALGENPKRAGNPVGGGRGATTPVIAARYPATRMGVEDVIREAFTDAKVYKAEWDDYNAKVAKGEHPLPPRKDLKLEPLKEVLEGKRFVHCHSYRADEILMLIRVADEFGFKVRTFQHVLEGYKVAKEMAAHGAGGSTFSDWWDYKIEAADAIPYNATIMTRKGVIASVNSDDAELMRHLNTEAAKAMKYGGATETEALAMVTINPAKQLGIDNRVGSIDVGKDADLVIYDKYPLSDYAKVQKVLIDGQVYFDRDKEVSGQAARAAEKQKLIEKLKQSQSPSGGRGGRGGRAQ
jgi:imidazolonepropionase-like amidohydrolase